MAVCVRCWVDGERNAAAGRGEFNGVGEQIKQRLMEAMRVSGVKSCEVGGQVAGVERCTSLAAATSVDHGEAVGQVKSQIERAFFEFELAGFDFGKVEDVTNEFE